MSPEKAKVIARNFFFERANQLKNLKYDDILFADPIAISDSTQAIYYLFNLSNNEGFILVSAEDAFYPVLAYSFERSLDLGNMPPAAQNILNGYVSEIQHLRDINQFQNDSIKKCWNIYSISNDSIYLHKPISLVIPLIQTAWDQGSPYNDSCPGNCYAGCVAVAMAQIMKYYNYPVQGTGQHCYLPPQHPEYGQQCANFGTTYYQWENMPNTLIFASPEQNAAVAQLNFHCGVGVDMQYCMDGLASGAHSLDALAAFKTYFNFDQNAQLIYHTNYSNNQWDMTIRNELDAGRPVYFVGVCIGNPWYEGAHAFVCDGYQNNNFFHYNFGWGGSNNGYFYSTTVYYNNSQEAIIGIKLPETQNVEFAADSTTIHLGSSLNFQDLSSGNPTQWSWYFPGGTPSTSNVKDPQNIQYNSFGSHDVKLIVTTQTGAIDSVRKTDYITVKQFSDIDPGFPHVPYGSLVWGDYDSDGLLDIALCGSLYRQFGVDSTGFYIYDNDGAMQFTNINANISGVLMSSISWGDYDNDGDLDLAICGGRNFHYNESAISKIYRNDGNGVFTDINAPLTGVCHGTVNWIDYDNDGDLDLLLTGQQADGNSISYFYKNNGNDDFESKGPLGLPGVYWGAISIVDYNHDGTSDILLSSNDPKCCRIYKNIGGSFILANSLSEEIGSRSIKWIDYDQDGDMDVAVSGLLSGTPFLTNISSFKIFKNYGNDNFNEIASSVPSINGWIATGDADNDGDLDLVLSGYDSAYSFNGICTYLSNLYEYKENYGFSFAENFWLTDNNFDYTTGETLWGDMDNDGDMDIIQFSRPGNYPQDSIRVMIRKNEINVPNTKPNPPTVLSSKQIRTGKVQLSWNRGNDSQTLQNALTYNVYVGNFPGSFNIVSPMAALSNGFRRIVNYGNASQDTLFILNNLEPGEYFWSVQSIDNAFAGSDFAAEQSFTIYQPPYAITNSVSVIDSNRVTLNGAVNAYGAQTTVEFQYGTSTNYGSTVQAIQSPLFSDTVTDVTYVLAGLQQNIIYHYRVVAANIADTIYGNDMTFTISIPMPVVTTFVATDITSNSATLNGRVNANNYSATVSFNYGKTTNYDYQVNANPNIVNGNANTNVSSQIVGLTPYTIYHFRVNASNAGGIANGKDLTFITSANSIDDEISSKYHVVIKPNPSTGSFLLTFEIPDQQNIRIEVLNSNSEIINKIQQNNFYGTYEKIFDLKYFSDGIYFVKLSIGDSFIVKKLIKQKE